MDYKPEPKREKSAVSQLWLYAEMLCARTIIDTGRMLRAYFDERDYFEFKP